jgi:monoterpene epsilon-lactone hydrolase
VSSPGFPPAILTTGTRDMLLSDTVLLHRALRRAWAPGSPGARPR